MKTIIENSTRVLFLIPLLLVCFAFSPRAQALLPPPPPDGGYPGVNTAEGQQALFNLTTGQANTGNGYKALFNTTTGIKNTATGMTALYSNIGGAFNTADGFQALYHNTADDNVAVGYKALLSNTSGNDNVAVGVTALIGNMTGNFNNAVGGAALSSNFGGSFNNAFGDDALQNSTGSGNTAIGDAAGLELTTGNGNVCIGQDVLGVPGESNITRIRNIGDTAQTNSIFVTVGAGGKLGFQASSRRYKDDIKPMDKASEALFALNPVSFRYKQEVDPERALDFGLIAEEVEKVNPDLVARNEKGEVMTVRYNAVNAMLLNEFLKQHRTVQELKKEIAALTATMKEQAAQIQKVSAQIEASKPAPQVVNNP